MKKIHEKNWFYKLNVYFYNDFNFFCQNMFCFKNTLLKHFYVVCNLKLK